MREKESERERENGTYMDLMDLCTAIRNMKGDGSRLCQLGRKKPQSVSRFITRWIRPATSIRAVKKEEEQRGRKRQANKEGKNRGYLVTDRPIGAIALFYSSLMALIAVEQVKSLCPRGVSNI